MRFQLLLAYVLFNVYSHKLLHDQLTAVISESLHNGSSLVKEEVSHPIESDDLASNTDVLASKESDFLALNNDFLTLKSDVKSSDLAFNKAHSAIATTFIKNPTSFVEAFAQADPGQVSEIITLLEALADESISQKADLENKQQSADTAYTSAAEELHLADQHKTSTADALQQAETADNDAQVELNKATNKEQLAQVVLDDANANLDSQGPALDSELATINQVIEMLQEIYEPEAVYEVGSCQPTGDYTPNECCPYGYSSIESFEDCSKAVGALASSSLAGVSIDREDSWDARPSGCFWHQGNNHVYYNNYNNDQIVNTLVGDDKVVCHLGV